MSNPPGSSSRSYTVTLWPRRLSRRAAARPAGPEPITATRRPVRLTGGWGLTQPRSKAMSMSVHSLARTVTARPPFEQVQAPSHSAGHTRPVNSGKGAVCASRL